MRLAFWRRPEPGTQPAPAPSLWDDGSGHDGRGHGGSGHDGGAPAVHPPGLSVHAPLSGPAAADVVTMPPEVAQILQAVWRDDPVAVEVAAQSVSAQGEDVSVRAEVGACGLLSQLLAEGVGLAPEQTSLAPEVLATMTTHGYELAERAAPLLPRFAPGADLDLARFCVTFASGALPFDDDATAPLEDAVLVLRVACVLCVTSHRPAPLEMLLAKLAKIYG